MSRKPCPSPFAPRLFEVLHLLILFSVIDIFISNFGRSVIFYI